MKAYNIEMPDFYILKPEDIQTAHRRIKPYIHRTPLIESHYLNNWLGHEITFKAENFQKIGAFKARGAINKIMHLKEQGNLPDSIVAFSAGNHSQGVAWAARQVGIKATIFLPEIASPLKIQATRGYGAEVIITKTRQEAEDRAASMTANGYVHAYDDDDIITGQGTCTYEALQDMEEKPSAIFAACGGGGLLSGSYLAKELISPESTIFGVEPSIANDASCSYNDKKLYRFDDSPATIADGVRTLSLSPRTFHYLQNIDGFMEASETDIIRWTQYLTHLLKITVEPTAALTMAGASLWLKKQSTKQKILIILSGGNIAASTQKLIWSNDYLSEIGQVC